MDDLDYRQFESFNSINQLDCHVTWTGATAGLEMLVTCQNWSQSLTCLSITFLDNYSWASVVNIGRVCGNLVKFHLTLWREDMTDVSSLKPASDSSNHIDLPQFANVQDLSIKCEIYVEFLPEQVIEYFFSHCQNLNVVQFIGPFDWIFPEDIKDIFLRNSLANVEIFVLSNTSSESMSLGLETVNLLLEKCPLLVGLGNLQTWRKIDYFDPESDKFYKNDSAFSNLKRKAQTSNWEIDFDIDKWINLSS